MERNAEIYYMLIHEGLIASRISDKLQIGRAAVSKQIKKLCNSGFIKKAENFLEHDKQLQQVSKGSATGKCNAYVQGPNSKVLENKIRENQSSEGVAGGAEARTGADKAIDDMERLADEWQINRLPGGRDPYIDVHRIDYTLKVVSIIDKNLFKRRVERDFAPPKVMMRGNWGTWGPLEIPTGTEGELGWNAYINRQFTKEDNEVEWLPNATSVRLTLPKRIWITPEQARIDGLAKSLINNGLWECINHLGKEYGIQFGLPKERQSEEYGVLWYDPEGLAKEVREKGIVQIAEGIHADDSHGLASEGIVHIDTDSAVKAADVANPLAAFAGGMKGMREFFDNAQTILDETTVMMEERLLDSADRLAQINQDSLGVVVDQMANSWQGKMDAFIVTQETLWEAERDTFFKKQRKAFDKIVEHFQEKYGKIFKERGEGQSVIEDWLAFERENQ